MRRCHPGASLGRVRPALRSCLQQLRVRGPSKPIAISSEGSSSMRPSLTLLACRLPAPGTLFFLMRKPSCRASRRPPPGAHRWSEIITSGTLRVCLEWVRPAKHGPLPVVIVHPEAGHRICAASSTIWLRQGILRFRPTIGARKVLVGARASFATALKLTSPGNATLRFLDRHLRSDGFSLLPSSRSSGSHNVGPAGRNPTIIALERLRASTQACLA